MKKLLIITFISSTMALFGAEFAPSRPNPSMVRIIPVRPTPEPDNVDLTITFPKRGQAVYRVPELQLQLEGFPIGAMSNFDRAKEIYNDSEGQSIRVIIDNLDPIEIYTSFVDGLDQNNQFFNQTLNKQIPYSLSDGEHAIRAFPVRSFGESLKRPGCFAARIFYMGSDNGELDGDLGGPYLTYNEPLESITYDQGSPILLDFYLTNAQLSRDGYKVRITIDDSIQRILTMWVPYYIQGLDSGSHKIHLELLDEKNQVEAGTFNDVTKTIQIR